MKLINILFTKIRYNFGKDEWKCGGMKQKSFRFGNQRSRVFNSGKINKNKAHQDVLKQNLLRIVEKRNIIISY